MEISCTLYVVDPVQWVKWTSRRLTSASDFVKIIPGKKLHFFVFVTPSLSQAQAEKEMDVYCFD